MAGGWSLNSWLVYDWVLYEINADNVIVCGEFFSKFVSVEKDTFMKNIILDFDGTIADTRQSIIATVGQTLEAMGLPQVNDADIQQLIGLPLRDIFVRAAQLSDEAQIAKAIAIYRSRYGEVCKHTVTLFPHVECTLAYLFKQGFNIGVASSKGKKALTELLERLSVAPYVKVVAGEEDVAHKKPAPDLVLSLLKRFGSTPDETLVVGDTTFDIQMGSAARCHTCGVTYGNHSEKVLRDAGADYIIHDFQEIIAIAQES